MAPLQISRTHFRGSFQAGKHIPSESPLEEAWSFCSRYASLDTIKRELVPNPPRNDWDGLCRYASARIRQAVELWNASRGSSLLSSPLTLYYSMLNLARGVHSLRYEIRPSPAHGLKSVVDTEDLLRTRITLREGSFLEFAIANGGPARRGDSLSLRDCLLSIPEIAADYALSSGGDAGCYPVRVVAPSNGALRLEFVFSPASFDSTWSSDFPQLASDFALDPGSGALVIRDQANSDTPEKVKAVINKVLWPPMWWIDDVADSFPRWWAQRRCANTVLLPRMLYYLAAAHALSTAVRYEPDVMLTAADPASQHHWLLGRFLKAAERYFPQQVISQLHHPEAVFF